MCRLNAQQCTQGNVCIRLTCTSVCQTKTAEVANHTVNSELECGWKQEQQQLRESMCISSSSPPSIHPSRVDVFGALELRGLPGRRSLVRQKITRFANLPILGMGCFAVSIIFIHTISLGALPAAACLPAWLTHNVSKAPVPAAAAVQKTVELI